MNGLGCSPNGSLNVNVNRKNDPLVDYMKLKGPLQDDVKYMIKNPGTNFASVASLPSKF